MAPRYIDIRFIEDLEHAAAQVAFGIKTSQLQSVAVAFSRNLSRIADVGAMPFELMDGLRIQLAIQRRMISKSEESISEGRTDYENWGKEVLEEWNARPDFGSWRKEIAPSVVRSFCNTNPQIASAVAVVMESMIVGGWTAFETLASDLWVAAVSLRPMTLGTNAILSMNGSSRISLALLREYGFDVKDCIGEVLRHKQWYTFGTLEKIREAYLAAFCVRDKKDNPRVLPTTKSWFSGNLYDELRSLEALRQVIVHRGGVVDKRFLEKVKGVSASLECLPLDKPVQFGGLMVREYVLAAHARGRELLEGVDEWLSKPE